MTVYFSDLTRQLAEILGDVKKSTASATGSTTTLIDTKLTDLDAYWNGGTIWLLSGTNAAASRDITTYASSSDTISWVTAVTAATAAADSYAIANADWPKRILEQSINRALRLIGAAPAQDVTLVTVGGQEAYTLPSGVQDVQRVEVAYNTTTPYYYVPYARWREENGYLYFEPDAEPGDDGYKIRLTYLPAVTEITTDKTAISNYIHPDRVIWNAAVHALRWRVQRTREDEPEKLRFLNEAIANANIYDKRYPIYRVRKDAIMAGW